ncbi:MAG: hypothetical protein ACLGI6_10165 [Gammaproteobacteria bacterium]
MLLTSGCGGGDGPSSTSQPEPPSAALPDETHAPPSPEAPPPPPATSLPPAPTTPPDSTQAPALTTAVTESIQLAPTYSPLVASTITAAPYWPVWWGTAKPVDGVNCLVNGTFHKHALISIYNNGKRLGFPDGIGRVHAGCYHAYEMHVHDVTGIIHIEADVPKQFKLGQWFSLWQQRLSRDGTAGLPGPVRFYIIENATITRYDGDPYQIELRPHREVLIVTGSTMSVVPKYQWPSGI